MWPVTNGHHFDSIEPMKTIQTCLAWQIWSSPMGETHKDALELNFDRKLKLGFHVTKVTSDAGRLACRELDEALGPWVARQRNLLFYITVFGIRQASWDMACRVVTSARYVIFQMVEVAVTRILFRGILDRIRRLRFLPIPTREAGMIWGTAEIRVLEWRPTSAVCQNGGGKK